MVDQRKASATNPNQIIAVSISVTDVFVKCDGRGAVFPVGDLLVQSQQLRVGDSKTRTWTVKPHGAKRGKDVFAGIARRLDPSGKRFSKSSKRNFSDERRRRLRQAD